MKKLIFSSIAILVNQSYSMDAMQSAKNKILKSKPMIAAINKIKGTQNQNKQKTVSYPFGPTDIYKITWDVFRDQECFLGLFPKDIKDLLKQYALYIDPRLKIPDWLKERGINKENYDKVDSYRLQQLSFEMMEDLKNESILTKTLILSFIRSWLNEKEYQPLKTALAIACVRSGAATNQWERPPYTPFHPEKKNQIVCTNDELYDCMYYNNLHLAQVLLESGANPNSVTIFNRESMLLLAKTPEMVELLMKHGADPKQTKDALEENIFLRPRFFCSHDFDFIDRCLRLGFDINEKDEVGNSPLHCFIIDLQKNLDYEDIKKLELLLKHGAKVETKNNEGLSPVDCIDRKIQETPYSAIHGTYEFWLDFSHADIKYLEQMKDMLLKYAHEAERKN